MNKTKEYQRTHFSADVLREAITVFENVIAAAGGAVDTNEGVLQVYFPDQDWGYENLSEFLSAYRQATGAYMVRRGTASVNNTRSRFSLHLNMYSYRDGTQVSVSAPSREQIESVFEVFERYVIDSRLPEPVEEEEKIAPTIFIGHGHSAAWRDLKDHLHEQHGYPVQAYETGARAGHTIRDIIQKMMSTSAFALLVLTCDDPVGDNIYRARQNVVHETGLFQGCLGFSRAIVLLEEGVEDFSNIAGIHQLRFSKGKIKETFGDVLATIRREFDVGVRP